MNKGITKEVKIALVAIVGIILLYFGMSFLKGLTLFSDDLEYKISFNNIDGLSSNCPIYADGYRVGLIKNIEYDYENAGNIVATAEIDKNLRIPKGSTAEISSDLMGNMKVHLLLANNPRERVNPGETIRGGIDGGALGELKTLVPVIQQVLPKLDSIMSSLNTLLADPAIANTLHNAETITNNLKTSTSELNTLMAGLNRNMPGMMAKADHVLANTETLTNNLASLDIAATIAKVDATLNNVHKLTETLNSKEGTLGKLLNDPALYNNLNATMRDADSLMIDLKAHPKRYVHFSIFGRKDK